jgi:hypothetical protein
MPGHAARRQMTSPGACSRSSPSARISPPGEDWLPREGARFIRLAQELSVPPQYVDRLIVMDRGIINCA